MDTHRQADRLTPDRSPRTGIGAALAASGARCAYGALCVLWLAACARMEAPPGGPEDKTRPYVSAVYPAPGAVNAPRELKVRIVFSEWVAKDVERGKVWLSPPPAGRLKVEARGDVLEIGTESPLDENTTYVLGVAGTVKDLVGLPLEAPYQLRFSTGPALDSGILQGRLAAFPGSRAAPGSVAALYPLDRGLRARFSHLAPRQAAPRQAAASGEGDGPAGAAPPAVVPADSLPDPFRERPAYLAPADSLGRFRLEGMRPGRYLLLGFQDADQDARPDALTEPLAMGPAVEAGAADTAPRSLALAPMDTAANRLVEARWSHEALKLGRSQGTLRLRFSRAPHPAKALRRDLYTVRKAGAAGSTGSAGAAGTVPVLDLCFNPAGELELYTAPLEPDSAYVVACGPVPDMQGNPLDTSRDEAGFEALVSDSAAAASRAPDSGRGTAATGAGATTGAAAGAGAGAAPAADTAAEWPAPVFLGPRRLAGTRGNQAQELLFPARGLNAYFPRLLGDSLIAELGARLEVKADTVPVRFTLERRSHHEFRLQMGPVPLRGQTLTVGYRQPKRDTAAQSPAVPAGPGVPGAKAAPKAPVTPPAPGVPKAPGAPPLPRVSLPVADSAKLGALQFRQDASARGAMLVLRALASGVEVSRITPDRDDFTVDSLPGGWYAAAYFRDADRDSLWNPGRIRPWTPQEEFVLFADSIEVRSGGVSPGSASGARLAFPPAW